MSLAWFLTKVAHVWPPPRRSRTERMYFCTVRLLILMPSFKSSPRIRSAPQSRFLVAISLIKLMVSAVTRRSTLPGWDRRRQNMRNPSRCHRRTVSGCTMARARRHVGNTAAASRKRSRSNVVSLGCGDFLRRITTWCLSIAFSMTSTRRLRTMSAATPRAPLGPSWVPPLSTWRRLSTGPRQRCDAGSSSLTSTTFRVADQRGPPTKFLCCFTRMTMVASTTRV